MHESHVVLSDNIHSKEGGSCLGLDVPRNIAQINECLTRFELVPKGMFVRLLLSVFVKAEDVRAHEDY